MHTGSLLSASMVARAASWPRRAPRWRRAVPVGCLFGLMLGAPGVASADGLRWPSLAERAQRDGEAAARWSPWQGRIGLTLSDRGTEAGRPAPAGDASGPGLQIQGLRLLGDYFFSPRSGFHATGGLISGPVAQPWSTPVTATGRGLILAINSPRWAQGLGADPAWPAPRPYLGAGYSLGSADGRWSFTADVGLVGRSPGDAARWGPDTAGWTSLGDRLGQWQIQPLVQLGVNYAF